MIIAKTVKEARNEISKAKKSGAVTGFVPTMGYLHEGHESLVHVSKQRASYNIMSIFVNRIQFNDPKDFTAYPREFDRDAAIAEAAGVDLLFIPEESEMYTDRLTYIDMEILTENLCGAKRPGHFRGVFTVVAKLFNIIQSDIAVFGQKDIQQVVTLEKMVYDLNFPVEIIIAPTIREKDGLAMSSRNKYLTSDERERSVAIYRGLKAAEKALASGERKSSEIEKAVIDEIKKGNPGMIDYVSIVNYSRLAPAEFVDSKSVLAAAAFFGKARLIDNMIINYNNGGIKCVY
jgi:pantoate--beta-alanine ligase